MMKTVWLFVIGILVGLAAYLSLSYYHAQAHNQVKAILQADQSGSVPDSQMLGLQQFVHRHMGSSVAFKLDGAMTRDQAAAQAAQSSSSIYQQAQASCASIKNAVSQAQCNEQYLSAHLQPAASATPVPAVQSSNYTYSFLSPVWTPDLTGILAVISIVILLYAAFGLILDRE